MRKTTIKFFTISDYEEEEIWLREQHNRGWKLVRMISPCFYIFEACEPRDVIYRLDYKNGGQTEEYMQMVRDFGWEYFEHCFGWLYFRRNADTLDAGGGGELFSDNASRAEMAEHVVRTRLVPIMIIFLCCVIPNLINALSGRLGIFSTVFAAFFGVMFVLYVYLILHCSFKLKRIRERYRS
jgi:hypothetical protein